MNLWLDTRSIVGWDLSRSLERHSVIRALKKAILRRRPGRGLMIHSDRGVQLNNFEEAERILFKYIEVYYNQRKKHSANGWKASAHREQEWYNLKNGA